MEKYIKLSDVEKLLQVQHLTPFMEDFYKLPIKEINEWISVDEKRPESYTTVLIYNGENVLPAFYEPDESSIDGNLFVFDVGDKYITNATHWMPLPQPPIS